MKRISARSDAFGPAAGNPPARLMGEWAASSVVPGAAHRRWDLDRIRAVADHEDEDLAALGLDAWRAALEDEDHP